MRRLPLSTVFIAATLVPLAALAVVASPIPTATPLAISSVAGPSPTPTPVAIATLTQTAQATRLATLKARGTAEIERRLASLQAAQTKVNADTKLAGTDKTTLTDQLATELSGLNQLKATLSGETTLAGARTEVESIFLDYRVYALMLPKARLVVTADTESVALQDLQAYEKLLAQTTAPNTPLLVDMQAQLQTATASLSGFVPGVISLQPTDYNSDHTILLGKRTVLTQVETDLDAAQADAQELRKSTTD